MRWQTTKRNRCSGSNRILGIHAPGGQSVQTSPQLRPSCIERQRAHSRIGRLFVYSNQTSKSAIGNSKMTIGNSGFIWPDELNRTLLLTEIVYKVIEVRLNARLSSGSHLGGYDQGRVPYAEI